MIDCDCGWAYECLNQHDSVLQIDTDKHLLYVTVKSGPFYLYHCPMCGGVLPQNQSALKALFAPDGERARLENLTSQIRTLDESLESLGDPDFDRVSKAQEGIPEIRNFEYYGLSDWFVIEFYWSDEKLSKKIVARQRRPAKRDI